MEKKKPGAGFGVMILKEGKVLLGKRHDDPEKADAELDPLGGSWTMPGGKLRFGENFLDGVYREVTEETGVKIDKKKLRLVSVNNNIVEEAHFVTLGFFYDEIIEEPKVMEPDEITKWAWFDLKDLPVPMYFPSEKIVKNYLTNKIYLDE